MQSIVWRTFESLHVWKIIPPTKRSWYIMIKVHKRSNEWPESRKYVKKKFKFVRQEDPKKTFQKGFTFPATLREKISAVVSLSHPPCSWITSFLPHQLRMLPLLWTGVIWMANGRHANTVINVAKGQQPACHGVTVGFLKAGREFTSLRVMYWAVSIPWLQLWCLFRPFDRWEDPKFIEITRGSRIFFLFTKYTLF